MLNYLYYYNNIAKYNRDIQRRTYTKNVSKNNVHTNSPRYIVPIFKCSTLSERAISIVNTLKMLFFDFSNNFLNKYEEIIKNIENIEKMRKYSWHNKFIILHYSIIVTYVFY